VDAPRKLLVLVLAGLCVAACQKQAPESKAAVEAGLRAYLAGRPGLAMDKMEMEIKDVQFKGETAEADVVFRVKDGEGEMAMRYTLRRQGAQWVVEKSGAGADADLPPGHPPTNSSTPPEKLPRSRQP